MKAACVCSVFRKCICSMNKIFKKLEEKFKHCEGGSQFFKSHVLMFQGGIPLGTVVGKLCFCVLLVDVVGYHCGDWTKWKFSVIQQA